MLDLLDYNPSLICLVMKNLAFKFSLLQHHLQACSRVVGFELAKITVPPFLQHSFVTLLSARGAQLASFSLAESNL